MIQNPETRDQNSELARPGTKNQKLGTVVNRRLRGCMTGRRTQRGEPQITQIARRGRGTQREKPQTNADRHRLSPESKTASPPAGPNPILASSRAASTGGCQEPGDIRTKAAERYNVAKTTILHACSTEITEGTGPSFRIHLLCVLRGLRGWIPSRFSRRTAVSPVRSASAGLVCASF